MNKPILKVTSVFAFSEIAFLVVLGLLLYYIPHENHELIYYLNINVHYLVAVFGTMSFTLSRVNRDLSALISLWLTITVIYEIFFIFSGVNFSTYFNYLNFHILYIFSTSFQLFFTFFLFFISLNPQKRKKIILKWSIVLTIIIAISNYLPIFITGEFLSTYDHLFNRSYNLLMLNFSLLIIFWHQYAKTKVIFSEYLPNIISVYTVIIGLAIFHNFSAKNELLFHYFAQYFNFFLFLLMLLLFINRVVYLLNPTSVENENYIKNYAMLHGIIEKPRRGMFIEFYTNINRKIIISILGVLIFLGGYLFFFDKFKIFIRLNILILVIASIISIILAILTWHKRWNDAIGIFFKKNPKL